MPSPSSQNPSFLNRLFSKGNESQKPRNGSDAPSNLSYAASIRSRQPTITTTTFNPADEQIPKDPVVLESMFEVVLEESGIEKSKCSKMSPENKWAMIVGFRKRSVVDTDGVDFYIEHIKKKIELVDLKLLQSLRISFTSNSIQYRPII
jgi:hypothetical protein